MSAPKDLPEWEQHATVRVECTYDVRLKGYAPHPDLVNWEAEAIALDKEIEQAGGMPSGVEVDRVSITSETEVWE